MGLKIVSYGEVRFPYDRIVLVLKTIKESVTEGARILSCWEVGFPYDTRA